ncbi:MAG: hypothetical protein V1772_10445, partial [Chloroflexota bacterium]
MKGLAAAVRLAAMLVLALLAWQMVAEGIEPHWTLWLRQQLAPRPPLARVESVAGTHLLVYGDASPHIGKIAALHKGLVWARGRRLLVEEGYG